MINKNSRTPFSLLSREESAPRTISMVVFVRGGGVRLMSLGERKAEQPLDIWIENKQ